MMDAKVDIVIVNWNTGALLNQCLTSIAKAIQNTGARVRVIIVDNGSTDDSLAGLEHAPLPAQIIKNTHNEGFAAACNKGAARGCAPYILFLNPDTRLTASALRDVILLMDAPENTRIAVCGVRLLDDAGQPMSSCCRFPTPASLLTQMAGLDRIFPRWFPSHFLPESEHETSHKVDQVIGAFFFVRRELFQQFGGFDERFFVYFEELDLSYRLAKSGWESYFLGSAHAFHKAHGSSDQVRARRLFYLWRSRLLYAFKHFAPAAAIGVSLATILIEPMLRLIRAVATGCTIEARDTLAALVYFLPSLPRIVRFVATGKGQACIAAP